VGYLVAGFAVCYITCVVLWLLIEHRTKVYIPTWVVGKALNA